MKLRTIACGLSLCTSLLGLAPAYAGDFSIIAPTSVEQGAKGITVSLFESGINGLEAADLLFTFDSSVFNYVSTELGSAIISGYSLGAKETTPGRVEISVASGFPAVAAAAGSLVDVTLDIQDAALPGAWYLTFEASSDDYDVPRIMASLMVTPAEAAPEPATTMLVAMGIFALALFQRRRASLAWERAKWERGQAVRRDRRYIQRVKVP